MILENILFFLLRIINTWNSLPDFVVNVDSINIFENRLKGHIKNVHLHSCKHKTVTLKLTLNLTLTLTDTGGAVLTLMLGYRRLRIYKLKRKIQN